MTFPGILKEKKICDSIKPSIFTWNKSGEGKEVFSPPLWNPQSLTWTDSKAHLRKINLKPDSTVKLQPQKSPGTISNSYFRLALVFYSLLERSPAWQCQEMDNPPLWLIDWLSRAICSVWPLSLSLCQVPPAPHRDSPSQSPSRILTQIPQIPFLLLMAPALFLFGFTSSQSTVGKQQHGEDSLHQQHHKVLPTAFLPAPHRVPLLNLLPASGHQHSYIYRIKKWLCPSTSFKELSLLEDISNSLLLVIL